MKNKPLIFALVVLVLVASFFILRNKQGDIVVGYAGALSGSSSDLGNKTLDGIVMAVDEINNSGGINGKNVKLLTRDTALPNVSPEEVVEYLKSKGATSILGLELSSIATKYLPVINDKEMIGITSGSSSFTLDSKDDNLLRINLSDMVMMKVFADYAKDDLNLKNMDVIYSTNNLAYSKSINDAFEAYFEEQGRTLNEAIVFDSTPDTNYKEIIEPLITSESDGILIIANDFDTATIIQQFTLINSEKYYFAPAWSKTKEFLDYIGKNTENIRLVSIMNPKPQSEAFKVLDEKYKEKYGKEADYGTFFGYDSMKVLEFGIKTAKSIDPIKIKESILKQGNFTSVIGNEFTIDKYGDVNRQVWVVKIVNGEYVNANENE